MLEPWATAPVASIVTMSSGVDTATFPVCPKSTALPPERPLNANESSPVLNVRSERPSSWPFTFPFAACQARFEALCTRIAAASSVTTALKPTWWLEP